ncbi:MAG: leucyl aminopeptidase family protein, partial [Pseudomonadota bacterium]
LAEGISRAGMTVSDPVWRLPLWKPYGQGLDSQVADTNNVTSGGFAGAITAGLFLQKFVRETKRWVHFDVFAWSPSSRPGRAEGGEAQAIRAVFAWLEQQYGTTDEKGA